MITIRQRKNMAGCTHDKGMRETKHSQKSYTGMRASKCRVDLENLGQSVGKAITKAIIRASGRLGSVGVYRADRLEIAQASDDVTVSGVHEEH
jgi:hypothetical protein